MTKQNSLIVTRHAYENLSAKILKGTHYTSASTLPFAQSRAVIITLGVGAGVITSLRNILSGRTSVGTKKKTRHHGCF